MMVQVAESGRATDEKMLLQISSSDFRRDPDGTWEVVRPLAVSGPGGDHVLVAAGRRFGKGQMFMFGLDVAVILERHRT